MHRLKLFALMAIALMAVAVSFAATASASLPSVLFLHEAGEKQEALFSGKVKEENAAGELQSELATLVAKGVETELTVLGTAHLGKYLALFHHVFKGTSECEQEGNATKGDVHITEEWHLVYASLSPLAAALLFLVPLLNLTCGATKVKVKGSALGELKGEGETLKKDEDFKTIKGVLKCSSTFGRPTLTEYENEGGTKVKSSLLVTVGSFTEPGCENVKEEVTLLATTNSPAKMLQIDL